ncbi:uncharacterized protein F4822DRAFT_389154, partial [Hypoxylon trugodes]|uniref:uncharacterized protein n=1 Tax=Hypoxylon trugodes TaxID=326681 RepID=UPI0021909EF3
MSPTYGAYIPPFRRYFPHGASEAANAQATFSTGQFQYSSTSYQHRGNGNMNSRGFRGGRGDRGFRGGWGRGRGGGGYGSSYGNNRGNQFFQGRRNDYQHQDQQLDRADLYKLPEIQNYFWGPDTASSVHDTQKSTFHDSKEHSDQLSYLLLFSGANPRWSGDQIVFAKSKLHLLPDYIAKKEEHGNWELPEASDAGASSQPEPTDGTANNTSDANVSHGDHSDIPNSGSDGAPGDEAGPATSASEVSSTPPGDKTEITRSPSPAKDEKDDEAQVPAPEVSSPPSRMQFTDIRYLPPEEQARIEEESKQRRLQMQQPQQPQHQETSFPAITPIDYIPTAHRPIAAFEEQRTYSYNKPFAFAGWYRIVRVNILAPHSAELLRMQQQKWERRDRYGNLIPTRPRDASAWNSAFSTEWAVVKFEKIGEEEAPPPPEIEKLPEPEAKTEGRDMAANWREGRGEIKADSGGEAAGEATGVADAKPNGDASTAAEKDASQQGTINDALSKMRVEDEEVALGTGTGGGEKAPAMDAVPVDGSEKES